jgi:four helix bundle protein
MTESIVGKKSFTFALAVIKLYKVLQEKHEFVISKQLLRSGTSIGANIEEANAGYTRKDFQHKMSLASKEARETRYWLRLLQESKLVEVEVINELAQVDELIRMLTAIVKTTSEST